MSDEWKSLVFGLLQGITEFLPVSSSGHLFLLEKILNFTESPLPFFLVLHGATALSIITIFAKDLQRMGLSLRTKETHSLLLKILTALTPLVIVGLFFQTSLEKQGFQEHIVGMGFLLTGLLLFMIPLLNRNRALSLKDLTFPMALGIGAVQALAVLPGFSRSGWTISAGLFLGLSPRSAVAFSFLIALPAIFGALIVHLIQDGGMVFSKDLARAFGSAYISGTLSLWLVLSLTRRKKFHLFGFYLIPLGLYLLFF